MTKQFFDEKDPYLDETLKNIGISFNGVLHRSKPNVREMIEGRIDFYFEGGLLFGVVKYNDRLYRLTFTAI